MDYSGIDGAVMIMACPDTGETLVAWHGGDVLRLYNDLGLCIDVRTIGGTGIEDSREARAEAELWFDVIRDE